MSLSGRAQPVEEASDIVTDISDITLTASTITSPLVAASVTPTDMPCRVVIITSDPANTAGTYIRVGGLLVSSTRGQKLAPGQSYACTIANARDVRVYTTGTGQVIQVSVYS